MDGGGLIFCVPIFSHSIPETEVFELEEISGLLKVFQGVSQIHVLHFCPRQRRMDTCKRDGFSTMEEKAKVLFTLCTLICTLIFMHTDIYAH